jgi:Right handed beta helix region
VKIIAAFAVGLALASTLSTAPAMAQNTRTFVSPTGNDSAACSLAAPCRTFAAAYALTNAGGEIAVLGTAGYGTLTINKSISIVNGGGFEAGIAVPSGGTGITINALSSVSLRGLSIDGAGVGQTGIQVNAVGSLTVENCVIRHMTQTGIAFQPQSGGALTVSNSLVADNGGIGIQFIPQGAGTAVFNHVEASNNGGHGILVNGIFGGSGLVNGTAFESVASGNHGIGFVAQGGNTAATNFMVFHSVAANNATGLGAAASANLRLANSAVTGNTAGWDIFNGAGSFGFIDTYGDNYIDANGSSTGSLTPISKQ